MSGYTELFSGYQLEKTKTRTTGQRVFIVDADGSDSLPTINSTLMVDETGSSVTGCLCRRIRTGFLDQDATNPVKTCLYDTNASQGAGDNTSFVSSDTDQEDFYATAESVPMDDPSSYWTFENGGNAVAEPIFKEIGIHNWTLNKVDMSPGEYNSFKARVRAQQHTINDDTFQGWGVGTVKFLGGSGGSYIDDRGRRRYRAQLTFSGRVIKDDHGNFATDSWLYTWNNSAAAGSGWDKPQDSSSDYLYTKTNFNLLT